MKIKFIEGFTLVELLIVIAILSIIAVTAVPSYQDTLERNRIKEAAEALQADLQLAHTEAVKRSANITINRSTGSNGAWCYGFNDNLTVACDCTQTDKTQTNYCALKRIMGSSYSGTNLSSASADNIAFNFRRGTANPSNTCFSTDNYKLRVVVANTGRVTICSNSGASHVPGYDNCSTNC